MKNTNATNYKELFAQKKALMDVIEDVLSDIDYRETSLLRDYVEDGQEPKTDNEGRPLYKDEYGEKTTEVTDTPIMRTLYKEVQKDPSQLDERDKARYDAIQKIKEAILALA